MHPNDHPVKTYGHKRLKNSYLHGLYSTCFARSCGIFTLRAITALATLIYHQDQNDIKSFSDYSLASKQEAQLPLREQGVSFVLSSHHNAAFRN